MERLVVQYSEACDELAKLIKSDRWVRVRDGMPIQEFCDLIQDGETPKMALSLVKKDYFSE